MTYCPFRFGTDNVQVKRSGRTHVILGILFEPIVLESNNCHIIPVSGSGGIKGNAPGKAQSAKVISIVRICHISLNTGCNRVTAFCEIIVKSPVFHGSAIGYVFENLCLFKQGESFSLLGSVWRKGVVVEGIGRFTGCSLLHHGAENLFPADIGIVAIACVGIRIIGSDLQICKNLHRKQAQQHERTKCERNNLFFHSGFSSVNKLSFRDRYIEIPCLRTRSCACR